MFRATPRYPAALRVGTVLHQPRRRDGDPRGARNPKRRFDDGVFIRSSGDMCSSSPPLIIDEIEIETVFAAIRCALDAIG
jgi:beta-alanine--pyruvate transaminase